METVQRKSNPNRSDDKLRIKRFMRAKKNDDPIPLKRRARIADTEARKLRKVIPRPSGKCQLCMRWDDNLTPWTMYVCRKCMTAFLKRGDIDEMKKHHRRHYCDNCKIRVFTVWEINPYACMSCSTRIGNKDKYYQRDVDKHRNNEEKKLPWKQKKTWKEEGRR